MSTHCSLPMFYGLILGGHTTDGTSRVWIVVGMVDASPSVQLVLRHSSKVKMQRIAAYHISHRMIRT